MIKPCLHLLLRLKDTCLISSEEDTGGERLSQVGVKSFAVLHLYFTIAIQLELKGW